jgi:hypothetical protein
MKHLFSVLLIGASMLPFAARADIAPDPGTHEFSTHAKFDNLADYPGYDVYASLQWRFGPSATLAKDAVAPTLEDVESNGHSTSDLPPFFAIKKNNQALIAHKDDPGGEQGDIWDDLPENLSYMIGATVTGVGSVLDVTSRGTLPDSNPAVYIVWTYHIDRLTDTEFAVRFVSESHYDAAAKLVSGPALPSVRTASTAVQPTSETAPDATDPVVVSAPVATPSNPSSAPYWIAIVIMGAAILVLATKAWKK